jgi:hypothetical protein
MLCQCRHLRHGVVIYGSSRELVWCRPCWEALYSVDIEQYPCFAADVAAFGRQCVKARVWWSWEWQVTCTSHYLAMLHPVFCVAFNSSLYASTQHNIVAKQIIVCVRVLLVLNVGLPELQQIVLLRPEMCCM